MSILLSQSSIFTRFRATLLSNNAEKGFTFIELLISLSILFIMTSMAVPAMTQTLNQTRQNGHLSTIMSYLQLTRTEAIFQNKTMLMCKSSDLISCDPQSDWEQGWIIFADENNDHQRNTNESIYFSHGKLSHVTKIIYASFSGGSDYVKFYQAGFSHTNGTFVICSAYGTDQAKSVVISQTGRIRSEEQSTPAMQRKCLPFVKN